MKYQEAKPMIETAKILQRYSDPCVCNTIYQTADGRVWFESESRLEAPENDYTFIEITDPNRIRELTA